MLLDLASLRPELGKGTILDDIPPGEYKVSILFPFSKETSNTIEIELIQPTEDELKFLGKVQKLGVVTIRSFVNWNKASRDRLVIPDDYILPLSVEAKNQLGFHLLLSKVLRAENSLTEKERGIQVQDYLSLEKECLLLECDDFFGNSQGVAEKKKLFLEEHPELKWRLDRRASDFLRFSKKKFLSKPATEVLNPPK